LLERKLRQIKFLGVIAFVGILQVSALHGQPSHAAPPPDQESQLIPSKPAASASGSTQKNEKESATHIAPNFSDKPSGNNPGAAAAGVDGDTYRIGIGDQLQISVWHEHDLSLGVAVRPDGVITMPLLNDLYVVGQTPKELAMLLTEKLKPYVNEPQVTVSVSMIQSRKVYLVGQVGHQGAFPLNDGKTAFELITEAGGLGPFAKKNSIYILRVVGGKEQKIPFNYKKVISGQGQDVKLLPGDRVVVP
jgi:polysaccharide biosynthesis/export protein